MKNILITISLIFIVACNNPTYDVYRIKNNTGHKIIIAGYDKYNHNNGTAVINKKPFRKESFEIPSLEEYSRVYPTGEDGGGVRGIFEIGGVDSIVILFNSERQIIQTCKEFYPTTCLARSIFDVHTSYCEICDKDNNCDYTYLITQEDYDNAEPIE